MNRRGFLHAAAAGLTASRSTVAQRNGRVRHVLVISIDGLPAHAWKEQRLPVPTLRRLEAEGVRAEGMTTVNPSVTWPNHTSMITGVSPARHGVLFNGLPTFPRADGPVIIEQWRDKVELVLAPTVYDVAHVAGITTAQVDWVAIQNAPTITWEFPEIPKVEGKIEREMMRLGLIDEPGVRDFMRTVPAWRDQMWTEAGAYILQTYKPGLMLFHLLNVDAINHRFGEGNWASNTAYAFADRCVARLLEALKGSEIADTTAVIVVSDHGFMNVKRTIRPNVVLSSMGLVRNTGNRIECDAWAIPEGGSAMLYIRKKSDREELRRRLIAGFSELEGIAKVLGADEAVRHGLPHPEHSDRMADLVLAGKPGYAFAADISGPPLVDVIGTAGTHGFLSEYAQMNATFLASGAGIRKGARLGMVRNVDVAPTIAALLGLRMPDVEGRVLSEILEL